LIEDIFLLGELKMQSSNDLKFVYNAPEAFLDNCAELLQNTLDLEAQSKNIAETIHLKLNFIVICAAAVEAHLNWFYWFEKGINVDNISPDSGKRKFMTIEDKISGAPLKDNNKGGVKAIFTLRDQVMHTKYIPRGVTNEYMYDSSLMRLSFQVLVNVCKDLIDSCPETLKDRISINSHIRDLAECTIVRELRDSKTNNRLNWIEIIRTGRVGLPIPHRVDV
jgi:hypothetical protein